VTDDNRSLTTTEDQQQITARAKTIFSDHDGNISSMRLMAFSSFLTAAALALLPMFGWADNQVDQNLILYFLVAAFGGKSLQKFAEKSK